MTQHAATSQGWLRVILDAKREELRAAAGDAVASSDFEPSGDVVRKLSRGPGAPLRIIAEIKHRSPSAGALSTALTTEARALVYARAGATMISVLTDATFFGGSYADLARARRALEQEMGGARPRLLCKEFVIDELQLEWARSSGADAILFIVRALREVTTSRAEATARLAALVDASLARGLEPIVEVASDDELEAARATLARVVGVNARDLDTLAIDAAGAARVLADAAKSHVAAHFSGLKDAPAVREVSKSSAHAALVGEALMRRDDPRPLLEDMVAAAAG